MRVTGRRTGVTGRGPRGSLGAMKPGKSIAVWLPPTLGFLCVAAAIAGPASRRGAVAVTIPAGRRRPRRSAGRHRLGRHAQGGSTRFIGRKRKAVLRPTPGVLFAGATDVAVRGARSGASRAMLVDPTRAGLRPIRPRRGSPGAALTSGATAVRGIPAAVGGGTVLTMGGIPVANGGPVGSIGHGLLTGVFKYHPRRRRPLGHLGPEGHRGPGARLQLQADGRLDPDTPIRDERLTPTMRVEGELSWNDGRMTGEIRIVDPSTGEVIHRIPVDRDFDRDSLDDLRKLLGDLADDLIRKILDLLPTTTTTTTSTSSTTTTTTTTLETTTTTTTTTTAPTLPSTTTTTSSTTTTLVPCGAGHSWPPPRVYTFDVGSVHHQVRSADVGVEGQPSQPARTADHPAGR